MTAHAMGFIWGLLVAGAGVGLFYGEYVIKPRIAAESRLMEANAAYREAEAARLHTETLRSRVCK